MANKWLDGFVCGLASGIVIVLLAWLYITDFEAQEQAIEVMRECIEQLPRDQRCEYVITARVKEDK